jgi:hypothetical protein
MFRILRKYCTISIIILFSYLELLRAFEGTLSRWSRLHLQSLAPTIPHWARVVSYGPFFLCVIHKVGVCPSSGDFYCHILHLTLPIREHRHSGDILIVKLVRRILICPYAVSLSGSSANWCIKLPL